MKVHLKLPSALSEEKVLDSFGAQVTKFATELHNEIGANGVFVLIAQADATGNTVISYRGTCWETGIPPLSALLISEAEKCLVNEENPPSSM